MKKVLFFGILISLFFTMTGCDFSSNYDAAIDALEHKNYEQAFELLDKTILYKDSETLLKENIEVYVNDLITKNQYEKAIEIIESYNISVNLEKIYRETIIAQIEFYMQNGNYMYALKKLEQYTSKFNLGELKQEIIRDEKLDNIYIDAKALFEKNRLDEAFDKLRELPEEYLENQTLLKKYIEKYIEILEDNGEYEQAINLIELYGMTLGLEEKYNQLKTDKGLYGTYLIAQDHFLKGNYDEGFSILKQLPQNYRNTKSIFNSYDVICNTVFVGEHKNGTLGKASQEISFKMKYKKEYEEFRLYTNKKIFFSDGSIYKEYDFFVHAEEINGNRIEHRGYTWTMDEDGNLIEVEKNETFYYEKK